MAAFGLQLVLGEFDALAGQRWREQFVGVALRAAVAGAAVLLVTTTTWCDFVKTQQLATRQVEAATRYGRRR